MGNIINGNTAQVKSQTQLVLFLNPSGNDVGTGINIINGSVAQIKSQTVPALLIEQDGNTE